MKRPSPGRQTFSSLIRRGLPLSTGRLQITAPENPEDFRRLFALMVGTDIAQGLRFPAGLDFPGFSRRIRATPSYQLLLVRERAGGALVGVVGAWQKSPLPRHPQIFYGIHPEFRGRGYAREAAQALLEHLFQIPGLPGVAALLKADHPGSERVLRGLGLQEGPSLPSTRVFAISRQQFLDPLLAAEPESPGRRWARALARQIGPERRAALPAPLRKLLDALLRQINPAPPRRFPVPGSEAS